MPRQPTVLLEDNSAAIIYSTGEGQSQNLRHIDVRRYAIREMANNEIVKLVKVLGTENVADMLTKALSRQPLEYLQSWIFRQE